MANPQDADKMASEIGDIPVSKGEEQGPEALTATPSNGQTPPSDSPSLAPPPPPAPASTSSTAATDSMAPPATPTTPSARRPYQPQFTAMTETILQRMRSGNTTLSLAIAGARAAGEIRLSPAKFEDARRRLVQSLKTSDNIQLPASPSPRVKGAMPSRTPGGPSTPQSLKRKRSQLDRGSPFSDPDADGPQLKKLAPRPPVRKKKPKDDGSGTRRCSRCDRHAFTEGNFFITCPRCEESWHLLCNPPEVVKAWREDASRFRCFGCLEEARQLEEYQRAKVEFAQLKKQYEITRTRERLVSGLPIGVSFDKPERIGFGPGGATDAEKTAYFSAMPRRDLLSLLSFCDKLRPNLLVDLLVSVTKRHPELPVFNSPDWASQLVESTSPHRKSLSIDPGQRSPRQAGPGTPTQKTAAAAGGQAAPPKQTQTVDAADAWDDDDDFLPPSWPKEGEGMYAALPAESQDLEHLVDRDEGGAFQGFSVERDADGGMKVKPTACC
ncbi:uncharacterized protein DNG_00390 [Cephalotrichum gorgonifer]|uniref:PHD-type domain-containing protein n=1 Tax=Cephalotrichum gorgonifer TaxID=2041049 RepID=A0AAE8MQS6_9PEZI|nr:uncharacterized protein DNG_00390 [Cephalotrichum gorgonifer]